MKIDYEVDAICNNRSKPIDELFELIFLQKHLMVFLMNLFGYYLPSKSSKVPYIFEVYLI